MLKKKITIMSLLFLTILAAIVISVSVYFGVIRVNVDGLYYDETYKENQEITNHAKLYFESKFNEQISIISGVEVAHHNIAINEGAFEDSYYQTVIEHSEYIESLEIYDLSGTIVYSSLTEENRKGINISNNPLVNAVTEPHELHIGSLVYNATFDSLCLEVVYSGEVYSVHALISVGYFQAYGEDFKSSFSEKEIMILDPYGKYLYDGVNDNHLIQKKYFGFNELLLLESNEFKTVEIYGEDSIVSFDSIELIDGYVVIYETLDSSLSINSIMNYYYTLIMIITILLFVSIFWFVFMKFNKELQLILFSFEQIGTGEFTEHLSGSNIKEFDVLRYSFNDTSVKIKTLKDSLEYLAYHDQLTSLYSRNKAEQDFNDFKYSKVAFIYLDIERFTLINENYGFEMGNNMLKELAFFLSGYSMYVYRVEGDEYLILKPYDDFNEVETLINAIQDKTKNGLVIDQYKIYYKFKIGVSLFPKMGETFSTLLQNASTPLHFYKKDHSVNYLMYDEVKSEEYNRKSKIELILNNTNISKEFTTVYQPIVDANTEEIRGFESLSRWTNQELGFVSPAEFIPILEKTRRIHILDRKVLHDAMKISKFVQKEYGKSITASVNMSVYTIMRDDFIDMIDDALDRFDFEPIYLELEITESAFIEDFDIMSSKMDYLKAKGVKFSEDDFGEAYSSLTYLTKLDIDTLKISRMFLSSILDSVESRVLVQTIVELSKRLGFYTIVEGVEDQETLELFKKYGCDFIQGYLFYRPMKEEDLIKLFDKKQ